MRSRAGKSATRRGLECHVGTGTVGRKDQPLAGTAVSSGQDGPLPSSENGISCHQSDPKGLIEVLEKKTLLRGGTGGTLSHITLLERELLLLAVTQPPSWHCGRSVPEPVAPALGWLESEEGLSQRICLSSCLFCAMVFSPWHGCQDTKNHDFMPPLGTISFPKGILPTPPPNLLDSGLPKLLLPGTCLVSQTTPAASPHAERDRVGGGASLPHGLLETHVGWAGGQRGASASSQAEPPMNRTCDALSLSRESTLGGAPQVAKA